MKRFRLESLLMIVSLLGIVISAQAQKAYTLKTHKVFVEGTSTVHDWSSEVTNIEWAGQITTEGTAVKAVQGVAVTMLVESIKSEKGETMNEKTYEAFKYEKNPTITFKMTSATVTGTTINANGTLTMAGVSKPIVMTVDAKVRADGSVFLSGSQKLNMKDFSMVPPKAVMGTIKVGEKITLLFELTLSPQ